MKRIRIGIVGYGNLGKGVEYALLNNPDMELVAIFTRRDPASIQPVSQTKVYRVEEAPQMKDAIDVMILCGGSATDLPEQTPHFAQYFTTIDSFDTHAQIPAFFDKVHKAATNAGTLSIISVGWDPGLFSLQRVLGEAVLPKGSSYTFWGHGLSQGHSDAIRRIPGVKKGVQYTKPVPSALARVRNGENPTLTTREKHTRECWIVLDETANAQAVEQAIVTMPNYFDEYDTTVHFISEEEFMTKHTGMPHGGFVMRSGETIPGEKQAIEFSLKLDSNPNFTASVLVAYARAAYRLRNQGEKGAKTVLDIPIGYLSPHSPEVLRKEML